MLFHAPQAFHAASCAPIQHADHPAAFTPPPSLPHEPRCAASEPHSLIAVDITDEDKASWWAKYKYDIPVLHLNGQYWAKHRLEEEEAMQALRAAREGTFKPPEFGEPDAEKFERAK